MENCILDLLSRWWEGTNIREQFRELTKDRDTPWIKIPDTLFRFSIVELQWRLAELDQKVYKKMKKVRAVKTHKNIAMHAKIYKIFCKRFSLIPFPAPAWQFCRFAVYLADTHKLKPGSVSNYVGSVRMLHKIGDYLCPSSNQIWYDMMIKGIRKDDVQPVWQAQAITPQILRKLAATVRKQDLIPYAVG